jgi:hypothetical protein
MKYAAWILVGLMIGCTRNPMYKPPSVATVSTVMDVGTGIVSETIVKVMPDGRLYWRGREVTTDTDFRASILDAIHNAAAGPKPKCSTVNKI